MANNNQKRFAPKIHIKKGDKVIVISGASKGDTVREVMEVLPKKYRAIVDGVNIAKKHNKPTQDNPGGIQEKPMPIHISNLMLVDKKGHASRIGVQIDKKTGKKKRYFKHSGETIK